MGASEENENGSPGSAREPVEIEEYGKRNETPPPSQNYRIRVDKTRFVVHVDSMTGAEILALAGKTPESHFLDQKLHGGKIGRIGPTEVVDFTTPGLERFMTLPRSETEGALLKASPERFER